MRLLVLGAAGCVGREIIKQAIGHGHDVSALAAQQPAGIEALGCGFARGDACDFDDVRRAVAGRDAVICALAAGGDVSRPLEECVGNVVRAMAEQEVWRLVVVSASGTFARNDRRLPLMLRLRIGLALRHRYDDLEAAERRVMASGLDWTIVRPVRLKPGPLTGAYRVSLDGSALPKASKIACADVAALSLKAISGNTYVRRAVTIGY